MSLPIIDYNKEQNEFRNRNQVPKKLEGNDHYGTDKTFFKLCELVTLMF